eukprot:g5100.t1
MAKANSAHSTTSRSGLDFVPNRIQMGRLMKEQKTLAAEYDDLAAIGIYVDWSDQMNELKAMIVGPKDTPYEDGYFFFDVKIGSEYPFQPPAVVFRTTDHRVRFHPNLYIEGKVCLSILGTWPNGPAWQSCLSVKSVLITIQSILAQHPLTCEPGFEKEINTPPDKLYSEIIDFETVNVSVYRMLKHTPEGFDFFLPMMKSLFLENYETLCGRLQKFAEKYPQKQGIGSLADFYKSKKTAARLAKNEFGGEAGYVLAGEVGDSLSHPAFAGAGADAATAAYAAAMGAFIPSPASGSGAAANYINAFTTYNPGAPPGALGKFSGKKGYPYVLNKAGPTVTNGPNAAWQGVDYNFNYPEDSFWQGEGGGMQANNNFQQWAMNGAMKGKGAAHPVLGGMPAKAGFMLKQGPIGKGGSYFLDKDGSLWPILDKNCMPLNKGGSKKGKMKGSLHQLAHHEQHKNFTAQKPSASATPTLTGTPCIATAENGFLLSKEAHSTPTQLTFSPPPAPTDAASAGGLGVGGTSEMASEFDSTDLPVRTVRTVRAKRYNVVAEGFMRSLVGALLTEFTSKHQQMADKSARDKQWARIEKMAVDELRRSKFADGKVKAELLQKMEDQKIEGAALEAQTNILLQQEPQHAATLEVPLCNDHRDRDTVAALSSANLEAELESIPELLDSKWQVGATLVPQLLQYLEDLRSRKRSENNNVIHAVLRHATSHFLVALRKRLLAPSADDGVGSPSSSCTTTQLGPEWRARGMLLDDVLAVFAHALRRWFLAREKSKSTTNAKAGAGSAQYPPSAINMGHEQFAQHQQMQQFDDGMAILKGKTNSYDAAWSLPGAAANHFHHPGASAGPFSEANAAATAGGNTEVFLPKSSSEPSAAAGESGTEKGGQVISVERATIDVAAVGYDNVVTAPIYRFTSTFSMAKNLLTEMDSMKQQFEKEFEDDEDDDEEDQKPTLARPVVHLFRPHDVISVTELGCLEYTSVLWNLGIQGFPVLVKDSMHQILSDTEGGNGAPHVAFLGQSNVGKSTLVNCLLNQFTANRIDVNRARASSEHHKLLLNRRSSSFDVSQSRGRFVPDLPVGFETSDFRIVMGGGGGGGASCRATSSTSSSSSSRTPQATATSSRRAFTTGGPSPIRLFGARGSGLGAWRQQMKAVRKQEKRTDYIQYSKLVQQGVKKPGWSLQSSTARRKGLKDMEGELKKRIKETNRLLKGQTVGTLCNTLKTNVKNYLTEVRTIRETRKARQLKEQFGNEPGMAGKKGTKAWIDRKKMKVTENDVLERKAKLVKIDHKKDREFTKKVNKFITKEGRIDSALRKMHGDALNASATGGSGGKNVGSQDVQPFKASAKSNNSKRITADLQLPPGMTLSGHVENPYFQDGNYYHKTEYKRKKAHEDLMRKSGGTGLHPSDRQRGSRKHLFSDEKEQAASALAAAVEGNKVESSSLMNNMKFDQQLPYSLDTVDGRRGTSSASDSGSGDKGNRDPLTQLKGKKLFDSPQFAPVSASAGRTRHLFRFQVGGRLMLVDLPGYGAVSSSIGKDKRRELVRDWELLMDRYLEAVKPAEKLKRIVSLIDVNVGFTDQDEKLWEMCILHQIPIQIVLTKCDKSSPWKLHNAMEQMLNLAEQVYDAEVRKKKNDGINNVIYPYIHAVSALENIGMQELRVSLAGVARDEENLVKARNASSTVPLHPFSIAAYGSEYPAARKMLLNKVKVCVNPTCGKVCAFTMRNCNACGTSLEQVPISHTENLLAGFALGLSECAKFPLKVTLRRENEKFMVFDDLLALSPCHLLVLPTFAHIPDFRYLFVRPRQGLALLLKMVAEAKEAVRDSFWENEKFREFYWTGAISSFEELFEGGHVVLGMNYPPSQYWLHLQVCAMPFMPFHLDLLHRADHMHWGRLFGVEFLRAALEAVVSQTNQNCCSEDISWFAEGTTTMEEILDYLRDKHGLVYEDFHRDWIDRTLKSCQCLEAYREEQFEHVVFVKDGDEGSQPKRTVLNAGDLSVARDANGEEIDALKLQAADKVTLQNYGRPYGGGTGEHGKPPKCEGMRCYGGAKAVPGDEMAARNWWDYVDEGWAQAG